jgi:hypothetical protein
VVPSISTLDTDTGIPLVLATVKELAFGAAPARASPYVNEMTIPVESAVAELTIYIGAVWSTCERFEPPGIVLVLRVTASFPMRS